jgi:hypothetical protein
MTSLLRDADRLRRQVYETLEIFRISLAIVDAGSTLVEALAKPPGSR